MSEFKILLCPGHGATAAKPGGRWKRPLLKIREGYVERITGAGRNEYDGAAGYYREDIANLDMAGRVKGNLKSKKVFMSRADDREASVYLQSQIESTAWQRKVWGEGEWVKRFARHTGANVLISLHSNASLLGNAQGVVVFHCTSSGRLLAESICDGLAESEPRLQLRGIKKKAFSVLRAVDAACLVECGFHDNVHDLQLLLAEESRKKIAYGIAAGIDWFCA